MGRPVPQTTNVINHFSHLHPLQLTPPSSAPSPPCSACKLAGGNGRIYSCRPCNFYLHESCSKMRQVITHPSHPYHKLNLLVAPVYDGGFFNCDACGIIGTGFSYQCTQCDYDIHALCAYKPLSVSHKAHPHHNLQLAFQSPYGVKGFSCDVCRKIGKNQWLYRCVPCEFDAHVGCITSTPLSRPHTSNSAPIQNPVQIPNAGPRRVPHRPGVNPNPSPNPGRPRPMSQNPVNGPRIRPNRPNDNLRPNRGNLNSRPMRQNVAGDGQNGPGQGFGGSSNQSGYDGEEGNKEFNGNDYLESGDKGNAYEGGNDEGEEVDREEPESVTYADDYSESSDARSQYNDPSHVDLYPQSQDDTEAGIETNEVSDGYDNGCGNDDGDFEGEGDLENNNCDEPYDENNGYVEMADESESIYEEEESYGGMDDSDSQYEGGSDESNMFLPMAGLAGALVGGGLGMNNMNNNQYGQGQTIRPANMTQGRVAHLRATGRRVPRYMPNGGGNGPNGGGYGPNGGGNGPNGGGYGPNGVGCGPNGGGNGVNGVGNRAMNPMGMFTNIAVNMLVGGVGGIGGSGDGGGSSILGGLLGGESESQY